jgi:hypothetical protein
MKGVRNDSSIGFSIAVFSEENVRIQKNISSLLLYYRGLKIVTNGRTVTESRSHHDVHFIGLFAVSEEGKVDCVLLKRRRWGVEPKRKYCFGI